MQLLCPMWPRSLYLLVWIWPNFKTFKLIWVSIHLLGLSAVGDNTSSRDRHHYICCVWYCCVGLVSSLNYIHGLGRPSPFTVLSNYQTSSLYINPKTETSGNLLQLGGWYPSWWRKAKTQSLERFIILRYSGIVATLPSLFFTVVQAEFCQVAVSISSVGAVLTTASSGAIFGYRVRALWNGSILVSAVIGLFYVIMIACWVSGDQKQLSEWSLCLTNIPQITVSTQFRGDTGPHTSILSNCQLHPEAPWSPMSYASSVAFDTCVFILTVAKFRGNFDAFKSKVSRQVYNDGLLYFFLQTATNIVVLSIQTQQHSSFNLIKPATVPFSTLMTVTMGTRVFLNLRLFNRRQEQLNTASLSVQAQYSNNLASGRPSNTHSSQDKNRINDFIV